MKELKVDIIVAALKEGKRGRVFFRGCPETGIVGQCVVVEVTADRFNESILFVSVGRFHTRLLV